MIDIGDPLHQTLPSWPVQTGYLILHGVENERPPQHWQFLLAAALVRRGHEVRYPALPSPHAPVLGAWLEELDAQCDALAGDRRVVVCHSLACLLWFHAAARGLAPVDRVLLVAPPESARVPDAAASFRLAELDPVAVRASGREEIAIACSDADPYNGAGAQALYGDPLGVAANVCAGAGHITPDSGFGYWPFAEQWCCAR